MGLCFFTDFSMVDFWHKDQKEERGTAMLVILGICDLMTQLEIYGEEGR